MKKLKEIWWNSYHSGTEKIKKSKTYLSALRIEDIINLRDFFYDVAKQREAGEHFYDLYPDSEACFETRFYDYEDALIKISFLCSIIERKRKSLDHYCTWSPKREEYHILSGKLIKHLKKHNKDSFDDIIKIFGTDAQVSLDYLIESGDIELMGATDDFYWRICK